MVTLNQKRQDQTAGVGRLQTKVQLKNQKGFTLVEMLVASVIVSVAIFAIFTILSNGSKLNKRQLLQRRAYQEAERILEKPTYSYKNYLNAVSQDLGSIALDDRGTPDNSTDDFNANASVQVTPTTYSFGGITIPAKNVTAFIIWQDPNEPKPDTVSLSTVITLITIN